MIVRRNEGSIGHIFLPIPGGGCWLVDFVSKDVVHGFEWLAHNPEEWMREEEAKRSRAALKVVHRQSVKHSQ